jgi:hypothetical protein
MGITAMARTLNRPLRIKNRYHTIATTLVAIGIVTLPQTLLAASKLNLTLASSETWVDSEAAGESESGSIFTIAPGLSYSLASAQNSLALNYSIEAIRYSGLDRKDTENNNLSLISSFSHIPGKWQSQVLGSVKQTVTNVDERIGSSDNLLNDNRSELRQLSANTSFSDRIGKALQYQTSIGADVAEVEFNVQTEGANVNLSLNSYLTKSPFTWGASLDSQISKASDQSQQINSAGINLNYRLNFSWQLFADLNSTQTDTSEFDQDSIVVGFNWKPSANSSVKLGVGERDSTKTYSLDAYAAGRKVNLTASYNEEVTSARSISLTELFEEVPDELASESISIDPVLHKRADIGLTFKGRRSTLSFNMFDDSRDQGGTTPVEKSEGLSINFNRTLSSRSNTSVIVTGQKTRLLEIIESSSIEGVYTYRPSNNSTLSASLTADSQHADSDADKSKQTLVKVSASISF